MMQAKLVFIAFCCFVRLSTNVIPLRNLNVDNVAHCIPNVDQGSTAKRPLSLAGKGTPAQSAEKRSRTLAYLQPDSQVYSKGEPELTGADQPPMSVWRATEHVQQPY
jgi:hypothetical protein